MSSTIIDISSMPVDGPATHSLIPARGVESTQEKLALVIPTLREAENLQGLLDHVRSVLDPVGIAYEILVVDDDSRDGVRIRPQAATGAVREMLLHRQKRSAPCGFRVRD